MKRYIFGTIVLMAYCFVNQPKAWSTYTILRDASNLSRGIVPDARINCSSVTCLGSNLSIDINNSTSTIQGQINSASAFRSTTDISVSLFATHMSSSDAQQTKFINFNSTADVNTLNLNNFLTSGTVKMDALAVDTTTLKSRLNAVATDTTTLSNAITATSNFSSTSSVKTTALSVDTATLKTRLDNVGTDTTTIKSTVDATRNALTTGTAKMDALAVDTTTLQSRLNAVATDTTTINGLVDGSKVKPFVITVGTLGSVAGSVDIASSNTNGLSEALRQCNAMGLLSPSTASCSIFYKGPGVFTISNATIPAGVKVWAVKNSSTVWVPVEIGTTAVTVYGELDGIDFDWSGKANASRGIVITASGSVKNFTSYNSASVNTGTGLSSLFYVRSGTGSVYYIAGDTRTIYSGQAQGAYLGDGELRDIPAKGLINTGARTSGQITVEGAANSLIKNLKINAVTYGNTSLGVILVAGSSHTFIEDCEFHNVGGNFLSFEGGNYGVGVRNSKFFIDNSADPGGILSLSLITNSPVFWGSSSMTVITGNLFNLESGITTTKIIGSSINGSNSGRISETWISGNVVTNYFNIATTFFTAGSAGIAGTVLTGNKVDGNTTFLSDSGSGTKSAGFSNFKGNVEQ